MKPYIDFDTQRRKEAANEAEKNHFKLLNNAVYGKTMGNIRKRIKIRILNKNQDFVKCISKPTCINWKVFEKISAAIHEKKIFLTLSKPIYVGFTVLELGKWKMYNFHCNFMKKKFKHLVLLFTDTDSLYHECDEDPYEIMYQNKEDFDLSNQPKHGKYNCSDNNKVVGKMKDEYSRKAIVKVLGLKSKIYSILDESNNEKSTNKSHNVFIEFQEFYYTLFKKIIPTHTMRGAKSKNHNLGTYETNKRSLSCFDDQQYILKNGINTLAYGHKDTQK